MDASALQEQATAHVRDYLAIIWRRKWLSLLVFVVLATAGLYVVLRVIKPTYQSQSRIALDRVSRIIEERSTFATEAFYQTEYQYMGSTEIAAEAAVRLQMSPSREMAREDGTAEAVRRAVSIAPERDNRVVRIMSRQRDPQFAARVVNSVVDSYIDITRQRQMQRANQRQTELDARILDLESQIDSKKAAMDHLSREKDLQEQQQQFAFSNTQLAALWEAQMRARIEREQAEAYLAEVQRKYDSREELVSYIESPSVLQKRAIISDWERQLRLMEVQKTPLALANDPGHRYLTAAIKDMQAECDQMIETERATANKAAYDSAVRAHERGVKVEHSTAQQASDLKATLAKLTEGLTALGRYNELKSEWERLEAMRSRLLETRLHATINDTAPVLMVEIHERARPAREPAWPNRVQLVVVVTAMSVIISLGLAFFLEYMDRSVRRPEDIEQELRMPLVGFVPSMSGHDGKSGRIVITDPSSGPAESYRKIRGKLFVYNKESHAKVFSVTSTTAGEGKTTLASNLAIAFAQSGVNVLLIDADMRHPTIQDVHNIEWSPGLGEYLAGMCTWESVVRSSDTPGLSIIPCGKGGSRSAELIESPRAKELIDRARDAYDIVMIDTPPVLGVADATVLCNMTDATLFVVQASRNSKWLVKRARMELDSAGAHIVGVVLNRVRSQRGDYYYYHRYYPKKA